VIVPIERTEENAARGPESARSHIGRGGVASPECSPPARRRRVAGEAYGTDENLLSEGASAEAAWPRSQTADGGRQGRQVLSRCGERRGGRGRPCGGGR